MESVRDAWCNEFLTIMHEYVRYTNDRIRMLEDLNLEWLVLQPITSDIRNVLTPKKAGFQRYNFN